MPVFPRDQVESLPQRPLVPLEQPGLVTLEEVGEFGQKRLSGQGAGGRGQGPHHHDVGHLLVAELARHLHGGHVEHVDVGAEGALGHQTGVHQQHPVRHHPGFELLVRRSVHHHRHVRSRHDG